MPLAMINDVHLYDTRQQLILTASGLGKNVQEWDSIDHDMLRYVESLYKQIISFTLVGEANWVKEKINK